MSETTPFFIHHRAKKQSGEPSAVFWESAKNEGRALRDADNALEDAGKDPENYFKALVTNFPVVDELPPEGEISFTFCDFYQLGGNDKLTWEKIPGVNPPAAAAGADEDGTTDTGVPGAVDAATGAAGAVVLDGVTEDDTDTTEYPTARLRLPQRIISQLISEKHVYHVNQKKRIEIATLEMDADNSYVQNLLLACRNHPEIENLKITDLWRLTDAVKTVFPEDKRHELAVLVQFVKLWLETEHMDRGILVREWAAGNRISSVQRTDSGTNADGGHVTDRGENAHHTLDSLDLEAASALLPMDFDPHSIPSSVLRRAKDMVANKEEPWKSWSRILRNTPGILSVNRFAIFNIIRIAPDDIHLNAVKHREFVNKTMTAEFNKATELLPLYVAEPEVSREDVSKQLAAERGEYVEGISDPNDPKWVKGNAEEKPVVENHGGGIYSIEGLMGKPASNEGEKQEVETTSDVQDQETEGDEKPSCDAVQPGESDAGAGEESTSVEQTASDILAANAPSLADDDQADVNQISDSVSQNSDSVSHSEPEAQQNAPEVQQTEPDAQPEELEVEQAPAQAWPEYFEPGRYENVPNDVYHAANGISSTMVKDARVSLMYYNGRHVSKTIKKERSKVLDMGSLVHALALQPEILDEEFSIEPEIPEGALTTTATIRAVIDEYNNALPVLLSSDDIKRFIEEFNASLPAQIPLGGDLNETGQSYMSLPSEFQRIEEGQKQTATAMKACIKEYNATLPPQMKTSGSCDALMETLAIINPDLVAQEAQKPQPLKVSGTKTDLIQAVKSVKPDAVFADEILDAWRDNPDEKILVTRQQYATALAIQAALYAHPEAGALLTNPTRAVEVSYFGIDEETGLEIRTRPDVEITHEGLRIGFDLKTISMFDVKESQLKARLHREIIMRDYHLSAGMYCENSSLDKFAWIFVNKDEGYHWVAVVWASASELELGTLEYHYTMRAIANAMDTGEWPAPITEDYIDELSDIDLRRLDALRDMA
ncbi:RecE family exodeoxyribonuclease [Trabulsiella odontotermitis]|uniref:RecE family exodeoxyribonuclease n=1 Tax=Trabulsiella odontotermitis TaxID=379893 RepID=UPI003AC89480